MLSSLKLSLPFSTRSQDSIQQSPQSSASSQKSDFLSQKKIKESVLYVAPKKEMKKIRSQIADLTLESCITAFKKGNKLASGSFGEVVVNKKYPNLVFKLCHNFNLNKSKEATKEDIINENDNAKRSFESVYGEGTCRIFYLNDEQLLHYKDLQPNKESETLENIVFMVMLKIPGKEGGELSEKDYEKWLQKNGKCFELSPLQGYLQSLVFLQDKGIDMYDLHSSNIFFDVKQSAIFPIDLSDSSALYAPYEEILTSSTGLIQKAFSLKNKMEELTDLELKELCFDKNDLSLCDPSFNAIDKKENKAIYDNKMNELKSLFKEKAFTLDYINDLCPFNNHIEIEEFYRLYDEYVVSMIELHHHIYDIYTKDEQFVEAFTYYYRSILFFELTTESLFLSNEFELEEFYNSLSKSKQNDMLNHSHKEYVTLIEENKAHLETKDSTSLHKAKKRLKKKAINNTMLDHLSYKKGESTYANNDAIFASLSEKIKKMLKIVLKKD